MRAVAAASWMIARNDGTEYGKLRVYRLSRQSLVYGPTQIESRINQDTDISRQITLWDQKGSEVIRGELLVIPIEESLIYVQPLYLRASGGTMSINDGGGTTNTLGAAVVTTQNGGGPLTVTLAGTTTFSGRVTA